MNKRAVTGQQGEAAVTRYLEKEGFEILATNYRERYGEIDIIASKKEVVCFIEVKTRSTEYFPTSLVVTKSKQQKIIRTARHFALQHKLFNKALRFDVAIVTGEACDFTIRYLANAFTEPASLY